MGARRSQRFALSGRRAKSFTAATRPLRRPHGVCITHNFRPNLSQSQRDVLQAQGCEARTTLGETRKILPTPTGLCLERHADDATPLGLRPIPSRFPRLARSEPDVPTSQPLGFEPESRWDSISRHRNLVSNAKASRLRPGTASVKMRAPESQLS